MKKIILVSLAFLLVIISSLLLVSASDYRLLCLKKGEIIRFSECHPLMKNYLCDSDIYCSYCVFIGSKGKYCPAMTNRCNALGLSCSFSGGDGDEIDRTPPEITIFSPINGSVYNSKRISFRGTSDKVSTWYYKDLNDRRPKWKTICSKKTYCNKKISFDEGENNIIFKVVDTLGNSVEEEISFRVDSKKPKIYKTEPKKGFASGLFEVEFKEENPELLILYYGDKQEEVDISKCKNNRGKTYCEVEVDISEFDGQTIYYWFSLTDIAGTKVESKKIKLRVDTTAPVLINNPESFWSQDGKYIYFEFKIAEPNFDEINYIDHSERRPKWRRLCSRLKNCKCEKRVSFKKGHHVVDIQVIDEAGNSIAYPIEFDV